jgi:hypothetical protein
MTKDGSTEPTGTAQSGQRDFWAQVHVRLFAPVPAADESSTRLLHGYYRNLGIRSAPHRVQLVVAEAIADGVVDWGDTEWNPVDPLALDATIQASITPIGSEGVWYVSGRTLYSDSDAEPAPGQNRADTPNGGRS